MASPTRPPESADRLPDWLKKSKDLRSLHCLKARLRRSRLSTVCEEARCPNISECFSRPTATFLILGDTCTRACSFCSVNHGAPVPLDPEEPGSIAEAAHDMGLHHAVLTSPTRDDLPDRGASGFAATIRSVRSRNPGCTVEVLCPDFSGRMDLLDRVLDQRPDVFGHNVETVPRLYPAVRPGAHLDRSLSILEHAKTLYPDMLVKSGFMVGLGEDRDEIEGLLALLAGAGCDVVTIGQYLRPTRAQAPVVRYWEPECFPAWSKLAESLGIGYCIAGPYVRSSYRAREVLEEMENRRVP